MSVNAVSRLFNEALTFGKVEQNYLYKCPNHTGNLNMMRLQDKWCDVTIRVNDKDIRAHKVILAANLKYFDTMLSSESFRESKEDVIIMESVEWANLEKLIYYAYTGKILLTSGNALNLLELANYLGEEGIKKACILFLEKHMEVEDALRVYTFANAIECFSLKNVAKSKILLNFDHCSRSSDYFDFDFASLMDVLTDGKWQPIESQQKLFEGIMRWIMHDANSRKNHMRNLLNSIILSKLTNEYLINYLANEAYSNDEYGVIKDILFCYQTSIIEQKKQKQILVPVSGASTIIEQKKEEQKLMSVRGVSIIEQKKEKQILMAVGIVYGNFYFQVYNFTTKVWSQLQGIPTTGENSYSNSVVLNNQLYYISGNFGRNITNLRTFLQRFDPVTKTDMILTSSNILRGSTLCACSRFVYLCGGVREKELMSNQVLRYDPQANIFELLTPMPEQRWHFAAIVYQDSLHILGGLPRFGNGVPLNTVFKYDAVTKKWMSFPAMYVPRHGFGVTVLDGKLYAYGGKNNNSVEVYDPEKNSWKFLASMHKSRFHFLAFAHEGKLLAIRGHNENTAEVYDPSKNKWQMDDQISSGLEIPYPKGGLISADLATHFSAK